MKQYNNLPACPAGRRAGEAGITIYRHGDPPTGVISLAEAVSAIPSKTKRFKFVPQAFLLGGIFGILVIFSPLIYTEIDYRLFVSKQENQVVVTQAATEKQDLPSLPNKKGVKILQPVDPQFSLLIPKIGLNAKVLANVNPTNETEYKQALQSGVAHADGTYLPGENGRVYVFGHSTDYIWNVPRFNAVFYLLKEISHGDEIDIVYQGKRHIYEVTKKKVVDPSEVFYLKPKWGEEELVLQTCYPPGTTWLRLLVFAQPKNNSVAQN